MSLLDDQRAAFLSALIGTNPEAANLQHLDLMYLYLGVIESRTERTLAERLYAWGVANGVPPALAIFLVGIVATVEALLDEDNEALTDEDDTPLTT